MDAPSKAERASFLGTTGARAIAFPIRLVYSWVVGSLVVQNNTGATLYLSRTVPSPSAGTADYPVPPRTTMPVGAWDSQNVYVGSDGSALGASDTLAIDARETRDHPLAGTALPVGLGSQVRSVQTGTVTFAGNNGATVTSDQVIGAVNTAKTVVLLNGAIVTPNAGSSLTTYSVAVELLDATHVRATGYHLDSAGNAATYAVKYTVLELV